MPDSPELSDGLLITGATGFLGGAVVRALLRRGVPPARMRIVVRDPARAAAAGLPAASLVRGDLADAAAERELSAAAEGAGAVLHCAASLKAWGRSGYHEVNVRGTERLLCAVRAAAPGAHVVFVSSLAAAGPSVDGRGSAALPEACGPVSAYGASKRDAELAVVAMPRWTIVRPPVVYGPADPATRLLFRQANAPIATVPPRPQPLSVIHADDVVEALVAAVVQRPHGAVLPLDGPERTDTHAFVRAIAEACGRRARLVRIPLAIAAAAAVLSDGVARVTGSPGYFNRDKVRELRAEGWVADGSAARSILGCAPRVGLREGLARVAAAEGFLRGPTSATA